MKGRYSIGPLVLASTGTECFQAAALTVTTCPSKRQRFGLHVHQRERFEYNSYDYDVNNIRPDQSNGGSGYMEGSAPGPWEPSPQVQNYNDEFITNEYETGSNTRNKVVGKSMPQSNFDIAGIFSQMFPNQSRSQISKSPSAPRVALPNLQHMITEDDFQKITSHAISGGKFFTSLVGDALFNTAKLAMGAMDRNKTRDSMEATSYNDVCDFDDELCREIEDALAATENFKQLTEKSRERSLSDFEPLLSQSVVAQKPPVSTSEPASKPGSVRSDFSTVQQIANKFDSSTPDSRNEYYFASKEGDSRFSEYYRRSLEQQLTDIEVRKSKKLDREESHQLSQPFVNKEPLIEGYKRDAASEPRSIPRAGNKLLYGQSNVDANRQFNTVRDPSGLQRTRITSNPMHRNIRDKKFSFINEDDIGINSKSVRPRAVREQRQNSNNASLERGRANESIRVHITDEALAFAQSLNLDVYEVYLSSTNRISGGGVLEEDAIVTLDDVIWYCDRIRIGQGQMPMDRGYEFGAVENDYRPKERRTSISTNETPNVLDMSFKDDDHFKTKYMMTRGQQDLRTDIVRETRQHQVERDPRFQKRYVSQTRLQSLTPTEERSLSSGRNYGSNSKSKASPEERVPRFRQYPRAQHAPRMEPSGQRDHREYKTNRSKDVQYTREPRQSRRRKTQGPNPYEDASRYSYQNPSSMSQLIASQSKRRVEYTGRAREEIRSNKMSTVSLAKLIQGPREKELEQVSMNTFREPYQDKETKATFTADRGRQSNKQNDSEPMLRNGQSSHPSLRELSQRYSASASPTTLPPNDSAYYTNDALEIAEMYGVDLRNVAAGSDDPISADDVKHYIESRKIIRASRINKNPQHQDSPNIENELTYDEFASYFNDNV